MGELNQTFHTGGPYTEGDRVRLVDPTQPRPGSEGTVQYCEQHDDWDAKFPGVAAWWVFVRWDGDWWERPMRLDQIASVPKVTREALDGFEIR